MGGEGSMSQANQSLKYNRGQLGKRKFMDIKDLIRSQSGKTKIEFDKIDPQELKRIKKEIRLKAKKEKRKFIIAFVISIILTAAFFTLIFL
jgi:hypothetical protein